MSKERTLYTIYHLDDKIFLPIRVSHTYTKHPHSAHTTLQLFPAYTVPDHYAIECVVAGVVGAPGSGLVTLCVGMINLNGLAIPCRNCPTGGS